MTGTVAEPRPGFLDGPLRLYIGGEFTDTKNRLTVLNPATGEPLAEAPVARARGGPGRPCGQCRLSGLAA